MNNEMIEFLKSIGAVEEVDGGFKLTEAASEIVPDIVRQHESQFNNDVFSLWMNDMLILDFDDEGDPIIDLSEITRDEEMQALLLTPQEQATLDMIIIQYDQRFDKNK